MKRLIPFLLLLLPAALFAQSPRDQESTMLKKLGLTDAQVTQVLDIQSKTRSTIRQDAVQMRLLHAQMDKALLPASPNMQDVNGYITQIAQTRADMMKALVGARVQLRQIIGDDNFPAYTRFIMLRHRFGPRAFQRMGGPRAGGMMGNDGPMMDGDGPMMGYQPGWDAQGDDAQFQ